MNGGELLLAVVIRDSLVPAEVGAGVLSNQENAVNVGEDRIVNFAQPRGGAAGLGVRNERLTGEKEMEHS